MGAPVLRGNRALYGQIDSGQEIYGSSQSDEPMVFGPVDAGVSDAGNRGQYFSQQPVDGLTNGYSTGSDPADFGGNPVRTLQEPRNVPTLVEKQETSVRRPKADVREMKGREIVRQRYPDGQVQIARHVRLDESGNYINDGQWKLFDRSGALIAKGSYVDGEMEGPWARLHSQSSGGIFLNPPFSQFQGPFTSKTNFAKGKLAGTWTISDAKGQKVFEMPYRDGQRDGLAVWLYPGGKIYRRMQFSKNVPNGQLVQFDERGNVVRKETYQDGKRIVNNVTYYRPTNQKRVASIVHRGRLELAGEDDWWEAKPAAMVVAGEDVQQGPIRSWYQNGQAKMVGNLESDVRVGRFVWWHENGAKRSMGTYDKSGQKIGQWNWWHDNGVKSIVGSYEDDKPSGQWRWWDREGKLANEEEFDPNAIKEEDANEDASAEEVGIFSALGNPDDARDVDLGTNRSSDTAAEENSVFDEPGEAAAGDDRSDDHRDLEDISPEEGEIEELPEPYAEPFDSDDSSASGEPVEEDQFFQTGF